MPGVETTYLTESIGDALSKGVAAVVTAQPADPVEYLAQWLLRHAKNEELQKSYVTDKKQHLEQEKLRVVQAQELKKDQEAAVTLRSAAIQTLAVLCDEPKNAWQLAVDLVQKYTAAAGAYVANIVDEEEADWVPPEDPEADVETDDEGEEPAKDGEDGNAEQQEDADQTQAADSQETDEQQAPSPPTPARPDYARKLLSYVAASAGQEFVTSIDLHRPAPAIDDTGNNDGAVPVEQPAATFKILDELTPLLQVPAVALEPRIKFFRKFPKVGGYCAAAIPAVPAGVASHNYRAVLAADTLLPEGNGQAFNEDEVSVIWEVAQALAKALNASEDVRQQDAAKGGGSELVAALQQKIIDITSTAPPAEAVPEVGEAPVAAETEDGAEVAADDAVTQLEAELTYISQTIEAGKITLSNAQSALKTQEQLLDCIKQSLAGVRGVAVRALRYLTVSPPATFHVLRAALLLLGRDAASLKTWKTTSQHLNLSIFDDIASYNAHQPRNMELWQRVRCAYKGVQNLKDLEKELPQCHLGVLLLLWIKQVRKVARKAGMLREAEQQLTAAEQAKSNKDKELEAAKEAKAKADAEAAAAAEAEAAAAAAAEAEGNEEQEQGEE